MPSAKNQACQANAQPFLCRRGHPCEVATLRPDGDEVVSASSFGAGLLSDNDDGRCWLPFCAQRTARRRREARRCGLSSFIRDSRVSTSRRGISQRSSALHLSFRASCSKLVPPPACPLPQSSSCTDNCLIPFHPMCALLMRGGTVRAHSAQCDSSPERRLRRRESGTLRLRQPVLDFARTMRQRRQGAVRTSGSTSSTTQWERRDASSTLGTVGVDSRT